MESNGVLEEFKKLQINSPMEGSDCNDCATVVEGQEDQTVAPENSTSKRNGALLDKLSQHTKSISQKLAMKHKYLQEQNKIVDSSIGKRKENDTKVLNCLGIMKGKSSIANNLQNSHEHSTEELEAVLVGFERLILKLSKEEHVKNNILNAVRKIRVLKDMPLFKDMAKERMTEIERRRYNELRKIERSIFSENVQNEPEPKQQVLPKECEKEENKPSSAEILAKYINNILHEYLGDNQEKIAEYKCLPDHIEDLEPFANALVQEGYGRIVEGEIRINRKNNYQAFVTMTDTSENDGIMLLPEARRYAFDGDIVRAFVLNRYSFSGKGNKTSFSDIREENNSVSLDEDVELLDDFEIDSSPEMDVNESLDTSISNLPENENCCKAFVIRIVKQKELREIVGSISFKLPISFKSELFFKLRPKDTRMPMVFIPKKTCSIVHTIRKDKRRMLYVARVLEIDNYGHCIGELIQGVGYAGNIKAEIKAILMHNGLKDLKPYEEKYNSMWSGPMSPLSNEDFRCREDCRRKCVFTIDPSSAKDLDDAVSVEKLEDCEYEIGVHISDVSYYLAENSELDNLVKNRATSIYLVNEVIHMLPKSLCLRCSLLPGEDKFAFSVFWKWHTDKEELSAPRFTRSIINSCCKFAYEDVQDIIDYPTEDIESKDIPELLNGWTPEDIKWRILLLNQMSQKLKAKRFENGALAINNPKLRFDLCVDDMEPLSCEIDERKEANFLIEELMLLANQSVATFIHDHFPEISILRNHPPPLAKSLKALKERLNVLGLEFDISSSKSIYESMQCLRRESRKPNAVEACLSALLTKPMARARYFCSEGKTSDDDFWHYALSIPKYTHFTSPIRRYPDILVHRLLAAALNYCPPPQRTTEELHEIAKVCNDQKLNARNVSDESNELFFKRFIKANQPFTLNAVVMDIFKNMTNVVTVDTGHTISIKYCTQNCNVDTSDFPNSILLTDKYSKSQRLKLQIFSTVKIHLTLKNDKICGSFVMFDKKQPFDTVYDFSKEPSKRSERLQKAVLNDDNDNIPSTSSASTTRKH